MILYITSFNKQNEGSPGNSQASLRRFRWSYPVLVEYLGLGFQACERLVGALCMEWSEEWIAGRRYLDMTYLK